jgi:hypothetical protein
VRGKIVDVKGMNKRNGDNYTARSFTIYNPHLSAKQEGYDELGSEKSLQKLTL